MGMFRDIGAVTVGSEVKRPIQPSLVGVGGSIVLGAANDEPI